MPERLTHNIRRTTLLAVIGVVLVFAAPGRALAAADGPSTFTPSADSAPPGSTITVAGTGCTLDGQPAQHADVVLLYGHNTNDDAGEAAYGVRSDGSWSGDFTILDGAPLGSYTFEVSCRASDMVWNRISRNFNVARAAATTTTLRTKPPVTSTTAAPATTTTAPTTTTTTTTTAPARRSLAQTGASRSGSSNRVWYVTAATLAATGALVGFGAFFVARSRRRVP